MSASAIPEGAALPPPFPPPPPDPVRQALVTVANVALSDRKRAQQQLELNKIFLQSIYANIDLAIFVIDAAPENDFRYLEVNPAYERLTGIPAVELQGLRPHDLVPMVSPETATAFLANYRRCTAAAMPLEYEEFLSFRGRQVWWLTRLTPQCNEEGRPLRLIGTVLDITERKTIELRLQSLSERLQLATESAQIGIWDYDPIADRLVWDDQMYWNYGITRETFSGKLTAWKALVHLEDLPRVESEFKSALDGGRPFDTFFRIVRPDGVERELRARAQVQRNASGRPVRLVGVSWDVTAERRAQKAIVMAKEQAEDLNRQLENALDRAQLLAQEAAAATVAKSEFLANMSHEIRTPLNAVIGMSGLLLGTGLTSEQREFAETIRSSGDSLLSLINDILDYSKIESGRLELERQPFVLNECVEAALDVLSARASEKKLDLLYWVEPEVPLAIVGDVTRLRQVLVNLLSNAVKFTSVGEVLLSVRLAADQTKEEEGRNRRFDEEAHESAPVRLHFSVRDSGIGIPADRMDRLFKVFSQVDASTTRHFGGSGLGLAICKRLVELMGGRIWVESPGRGSTFSFEVMLPPCVLQTEMERFPTRRPLAERRVLIVDDNPTARSIIGRQLETAGATVVSAGSGTEALTLLEQGTKVDLALLDLQMPSMDGAALAAEMRQRPNSAELPVFLLTPLGYARPAEALKISATITKPIKPEVLIDTIVSHTRHDAEAAAAKRSASSQSDQIAHLHPLTILLAEDNAVNQRVAILMLQRLGYTADVVVNGVEALEALAKKTYDLVFMDLQMPEMDGLQASREINARWPQGERPRIVAMTANASASDRSHCFAAGMQDFISKPVRIQDLRTALLATPALPRVNADA